jgi:hypothetical protein
VTEARRKAARSIVHAWGVTAPDSIKYLAEALDSIDRALAMVQSHPPDPAGRDTCLCKGCEMRRELER